MKRKKELLSGWGNFTKSPCYLFRPEKIDQLLTLVDEERIPRGFGRSYGDAAINCERGVILMERMNRFLAFDAENGLLKAEAGVRFDEILDVIVPKGWFLPVTPGTKFVTLGGALAADVHGKNHHIDGSIGSHTKEITLLLADGSVKSCTKEENEELFLATLGGMGLTGIILEASLQLLPIETAYLSVTHRDAPTLEKILDLTLSPENGDKYSVAWIDCLATGKELGRSILMSAHHTPLAALPRSGKSPLQIEKRKKASISRHFPSFLLRSKSISLFNSCYYAIQKSKGAFIADYDSYFYPLDVLHNWNNMYGKKGFVQYQFILPLEEIDRSMQEIMEKISGSKRGSFLAVLKKFGPENANYLSFPKEGITLALDLPASDKELLPFLRELDEVVLRYNGRLYLAKDALLDPLSFRKMYPKYEKWLEVKQKIDPKNLFQSDLSRRLKIGEPA